MFEKEVYCNTAPDDKALIIAKNTLLSNILELNVFEFTMFVWRLLSILIVIPDAVLDPS